MKLSIPQQSLNLLRAYLSQPGWAKTTKEVYIGGQLLADVLPEVDVSWVKPDHEMSLWSSEKKAEYRAHDKAWCATPVDIELTAQQHETCRKCIEEITKTGNFSPSKFTFKLLEAFGFKPE